jgi:quercetin dioxygenase-like cupin family protein
VSAGFEVYDYRTVNRNVLVTPEIRARLYHMKPGQVDGRHSHDLGHEIFLILEGLAEFTINGVKKELGPGQMCIALVDEIHQVRNLLPDKETIMYLSVTPHVQPTHTGRTQEGDKVPPHFIPNANYNDEQDLNLPVAELLAEQVKAAQAVLECAQQHLATVQDQGKKALTAIGGTDRTSAVAARNAMWEAVYALHKQLYAYDAIWNDVAPRIANEAS